MEQDTMSKPIRRVGALLLAGALAGAVLAAPVPPPPDESEVKERKDFIPARKHEPLPGKIVGVLASDVAAMMGQEGRGGPPDAMGFSADGCSYRWVYTPANGASLIQNLQVKVGEKGDATVVYPALNMANAETVKPWDIKVPYALVEVEVNDGKGAPADESFVGTHMKRLDDTKDYPLLVSEVVAELKKRYGDRVKDMQKGIDAAMDDQAKAVLKERKMTGPRETSDLMYVTWLPDSESLSMRFRTTVTDGAYQYGNGVAPVDLPPFVKPKEGKEAADRAPPRLPPPGPGIGGRFGTQIGVEFGAAYEVSKTGKLVRVQTLPIQAFQKELPPPPAVRFPIDPLPPKPGEKEK
jgi:hypothetical protein